MNGNTIPVPPLEGDPNLREYRCPHCDRFLFKGNIQRLKMSCPHCLEMIDSDSDDFFKSVEDTKD